MTTYRVLGRSGPLGRGLTKEGAEALAAVAGAEVVEEGVEMKTGDRVELVALGADETFTRLEVGSRGTVGHVDDLGTVHVVWDSGVRLGLVEEAGDRFRPIPTRTILVHLNVRTDADDERSVEEIAESFDGSSIEGEWASADVALAEEL